MARRVRIRIRRAPVVWAPLLVAAGLLVLAGAATRFYRQHTHISDLVLLLAVLLLLVLRTHNQNRRR